MRLILGEKFGGDYWVIIIDSCDRWTNTDHGTAE